MNPLRKNPELISKYKEYLKPINNEKIDDVFVHVRLGDVYNSGMHLPYEYCKILLHINPLYLIVTADTIVIPYSLFKKPVNQATSFVFMVWLFPTYIPFVWR